MLTVGTDKPHELGTFLINAMPASLYIFTYFFKTFGLWAYNTCTVQCHQAVVCGCLQQRAVVRGKANREPCENVCLVLLCLFASTVSTFYPCVYTSPDQQKPSNSLVQYLHRAADQSEHSASQRQKTVHLSQQEAHLYSTNLNNPQSTEVPA